MTLVEVDIICALKIIIVNECFYAFDTFKPKFLSFVTRNNDYPKFALMNKKCFEVISDFHLIEVF